MGESLRTLRADKLSETTLNSVSVFFRFGDLSWA